MPSVAPEQAQTFLAAMSGDRLEALYVPGPTTGMREGELLGHSNSNVRITLNRYSHVLPSMQRDPAAAMERMLRA